MGLTFRAAWDAVQSLNGLFQGPLVISKKGGSQGGSAVVTELGWAVVSGYQKLERELNLLMQRMDEEVGVRPAPRAQGVIWSLGLKTSARNVIRGVIEEISDDAVNCEIRLRIGSNLTITSSITKKSVLDLGLRPDLEAIALIKASSIIISGPNIFSDEHSVNTFDATVTEVEEGAVTDGCLLGLDGGPVLSATVSRHGKIPIATGDQVVARVRASDVLLAVD